MAAVKVYRYDYYDALLKRDRRSVDYATADAIMEMSGTILVETEKVVDERLIEEDGKIRAMDVFMDVPARAARPEHRKAA